MFPIFWVGCTSPLETMHDCLKGKSFMSGKMALLFGNGTICTVTTVYIFWLFVISVQFLIGPF